MKRRTEKLAKESKYYRRLLVSREDNRKRRDEFGLLRAMLELRRFERRGTQKGTA